MEKQDMTHMAQYLAVSSAVARSNYLCAMVMCMFVAIQLLWHIKYNVLANYIGVVARAIRLWQREIGWYGACTVNTLRLERADIVAP